MPYNNAKKQISSAINLLNISDFEKTNLESILHYPEKIIKMNLKIKMDDNSIQNFEAYRIQHNNIKWPYKGGIRFHPWVTENEVKALSMWMTIKTAILNLPLGWWKGWIIIDPKKLSKKELETLSRSYVKALYRNIWKDLDIPAPDVNTNWQIMSWMIDEYLTLTWSNDIWTFTWKPIEIWGSQGRTEATGFGWIKVLDVYLKSNNDILKWKKIIVQGFWNVWQYAVLKLLEHWANITWLSDSKWAIFNHNWFSIEDIKYLIKNKEWKNRNSLKNSSHSLDLQVEYITNEELLEKECDILIPSALENVITIENVNNIKSKIILELANWPITPEADEILFEKWIIVIPDVLANSGWVLVSYLEQVQNKQNYYWSKEDVLSKMDDLLEKETKNILKKNNWKNMLRELIYKISIERVLIAMKLKWKL